MMLKRHQWVPVVVGVAVISTDNIGGKVLSNSADFCSRWGIWYWYRAIQILGWCVLAVGLASILLALAQNFIGRKRHFPQSGKT